MDEREWHYSHEPRKLPGNLPPIIACQKGSKGFKDTQPNQDNFTVTYFKNGWTLAAAFDGHGPCGHIVSHRCAQTVPFYLTQSASFPSDIKEALVEAFETAQQDLVGHALQNQWDVQASGSTAIACLWKGNKIYTANVGDSRCIVGSESDRKLIFETEDHKPNSEAEKARIESRGGEVRSKTYPDGWVNHRIFVKGTTYPGLCMARTFGDESVKAHGVIATPEVQEMTLDIDRKPFIILASDGVWEFMDSQFVVRAMSKKIVTDGPKVAIQKLQREAQKRWKDEEGDYCDDITSMLIQIR
jgi:serine/threonine protein phosphatase PrpC